MLAASSVRYGSTGIMKSRVATPASASRCIAARRRSGRGARGSSSRASSVSVVVTEKLTESSDRSAIARRRSRSRVTSVPLVVIESLIPGRVRTASSRLRVTSKPPSPA